MWIAIPPSYLLLQIKCGTMILLWLETFERETFRILVGREQWTRLWPIIQLQLAKHVIWQNWDFCQDNPLAANSVHRSWNLSGVWYKLFSPTCWWPWGASHHPSCSWGAHPLLLYHRCSPCSWGRLIKKTSSIRGIGIARCIEFSYDWMYIVLLQEPGNSPSRRRRWIVSNKEFVALHAPPSIFTTGPLKI